MRLSLFFRDVLTGLLQPVADELQQMIGSINAWSNVEHNENGRHAAVTATDLVVTRLRFPTGQSAERGHLVIVDDKAYGRPALDFGDATAVTTGYGAGFGYDNLPKGRIWVDSTSTSGGSTMYLGTTNAAASGITNAGLRITPSGGSTYRNGTNTTTAYQFVQANGTVVMNVDTTNARVGIGTAAPTAALHVAGGSLHRNGTNTTTAYQFVQADGTVVMNVDTTNARVGVGTAGPLGKHHVLGSGTAVISAGSDGIQDALIEGPNIALTGSSGNLDIVSNSAFAIDTGGQVALGGKSTSGSNVFATWAVIKGAKENATTGNIASYLAFGTRADGAGITEKMRIDSAGNVGIGQAPGAQLDLSTDSARKLTTNTWATGSDVKIKTNIHNIGDSLSVIRQMRPVKYRYRPEFLAAHPSVKDTEYCNFVAQEYQQVMPDSVSETDGLLYLNTGNMIPYAIAGIKELDRLLVDYERRFVDYERRLATLETKK